MTLREANCVASLIAKTALAGQNPVTHLGTTLTVSDPGPITSIAIFPGQHGAATLALAPLTFPAPNRFTQTADARLVWTGPDQAFLIGTAAPDLEGIAAVTDQSGGWATLNLTGPAAADALMRLVPLDLRPHAFPQGHAARAPLGHMNMILLSPAPDDFLILIFRSMARTAFHELDTALKSLAARTALSC